MDALYSNGLVSTFESVHALASRLLAALADDDFAEARFAYLDGPIIAGLAEIPGLADVTVKCFAVLAGATAVTHEPVQEHTNTI